MDLEPGWEKKALIVLAVITVIIVIYAYGPLNSGTKSVMEDNNTDVPVSAPAPSTPVVANNTTNSTNITSVNITSSSNGTYVITADQAKTIAKQQGLTAGEPTKGNVVISNNNIAVWIVPLMNGNILVKRIYVDAATGIVVGTEEVKH